MKPTLAVVMIALSTGAGTLACAAEAVSQAQRNHPEWAALYSITPELREDEHYVKSMA